MDYSAERQNVFSGNSGVSDSDSSGYSEPYLANELHWISSVLKTENELWNGLTGSEISSPSGFRRIKKQVCTPPLKKLNIPSDLKDSGFEPFEYSSDYLKEFWDIQVERGVFDDVTKGLSPSIRQPVFHPTQV
ncbi:hypothetical protein [Haloferax profundi]|uniref:hypothetical protein n=1 Tax=Haloferax profundi TaxID=1544718 RepID=UPI0012F713BB|nr:hypothetical protein [Haloferax profundi]